MEVIKISPYAWVFQEKVVHFDCIKLRATLNPKGAKSSYDILSKALHWVPIPMPMLMPTHAHGFWVGMGAILLFMGGHGWASVLCIPASNSNSESSFLDVGNTLTNKRSGLKPMTMNDLLFV
jgi:hypothetical protein